MDGGLNIKNQHTRGVMLNDLQDLLIDELHDQLSSEEQIVKALPDMAKAAESQELKSAFEGHLKETKGQIQRLKNVFKILKVKPKEKFCKATKGLIDECKEVLKDFKTKSALRDAALISKAQRIEHYEISAYGTIRTFAKELNLKEVVVLLQETLDEEGNADKKLTKIAEGGLFKSGINLKANIPNEKKPAPPKKKVSPLKKPESKTSKSKKPEPSAPKSKKPKAKK